MKLLQLGVNLSAWQLISVTVHLYKYGGSHGELFMVLSYMTLGMQSKSWGNSPSLVRCT